MPREPWWKDGIRFECQGSGCCCVNHGQFAFVYLTREDRRRLAAFFSLNLRTFTHRFCIRDDDRYRIQDLPDASACRFLVDRTCSVYAARPTQCRTWPFWPELMRKPTWEKEVARFCPGVGRGRLVPPEEIRDALAAQHRANGEY